jgi:hypothetical protein
MTLEEMLFGKISTFSRLACPSQGSQTELSILMLSTGIRGNLTEGLTVFELKDGKVTRRVGIMPLIT